MADQVLGGLRVLEIGHFVAAPFATRVLADLGADVIKIEPPGGDPVRQWGEQIDGHSLWWSVHGRNKRSLALDLKAPAAGDIVLKIVATCDVVVENFRPGQLARLSLGDDVMRGVRPDLIISHVSGYGQTGPYRDRAAFGVIGEAIGGLRYLTDHAPGMSNLPPVRVGVSIGDSLAGIYSVVGILAALWQRDRKDGDGRARTLDVALTESVLSLMEGMLPEYGALGRIKQPAGGGIATAAPTNAYPTSDGKWVLIAANSEPLFARLMALAGRSDLVGTPGYTGNQARVGNVAQLDAIISDWTKCFDAATLLARLTQADVPATVVYTVEDIMSDPQYRHRGMVRAVPDAAFAEPVLHPGIVPRVVEDSDAIRWPGPAIGAHTHEILREIVGLSGEEIAQLIKQGAVGVSE